MLLIAVHAASGLCAAFAGIIVTLGIRSADASNAGLWLKRDAIFAVVIGGNSLLSGRLSIILAVGMALVILSGGAVIAFCGIVIAVMLRDTGLHALPVFAILLVLTTAFGAAMGLLIHRRAMPAFIVTMAGMFLRGARPICAWSSPCRSRTSFYALGDKEQTARLMGVNLRRTTLLVDAFWGAITGLSGILLSVYTVLGHSLAVSGRSRAAMRAAQPFEPSGTASMTARPASPLPKQLSTDMSALKRGQAGMISCSWAGALCAAMTGGRGEG